MASDKYTQEDVYIILNQLQDIASAVMHAAEAKTVEQVLERIAHLARELIPARYAALGMPDELGGLRYFKVSGMTDDEISRVDHLPQGHGLLGAVMNDRDTYRLEHMREDPKSVGFPKGHPHMDSFLGTPIQAGEELFGMLYLTDRIDGQPFSERDEWLIETIAGYAALAIAGSQLREQQQRLTLLEERERISMELHDGVIQSLYAVGMYLDILRTGEDAVEPDALNGVIGDLNKTIDDIRNYIMNLKRGDGRRKTIRTIFRELVDRLWIPASIEVKIDAPEVDPSFPSATFDAICQIVVEALSNAIRHADAHEIMLIAVQTETALLIVVKDDGKGFELHDMHEHDGLGLRNIQQRARLHGGHVQIETAPGAGTRLTINIPISVS